jgi:hypothetical protein
MTSYIRKFGFQRRVAFFFGTITLAGAFSGLLAYGCAPSPPASTALTLYAVSPRT